jgi:hypothetical protein
MGLLASIRRIFGSNKEKPKLETQKSKPPSSASPPSNDPREKDGSKKSGQEVAAERTKDPLDRFFPLVNRFIATGSWEEAGLFVRHNLDLLSDEAGLVISKIAIIQPTRTARGFVETHLHFLQLCKESGIDSAVTQVVALDPSQGLKRQARMVGLDDLRQLLQQFVEAPNPAERRRLLAQHTELMFANANGVIMRMANEESDFGKRQKIDECHQLLQQCREASIDAAFADITTAEPDSSHQNKLETPQVMAGTEPAQASLEVFPTESMLPEELVLRLTERLNEGFAEAVMVAAGHGVSSGRVDLSKATATIDAIDTSLKERPGNVSLLLAKSSALRTIMQWKSGEDVIDEILRQKPDQFDARMIKEEWGTWPHLLQCPPCEVGIKRMSSALKEAARGRSVVLVRDGIELGVALIQDVAGLQFARSLSQEMRCKWEFALADTPYGRIVAHYGFVEDAPNCSFLQENILQTGRPAKADGKSGYWLLQQMARFKSSLILLVVGDKVVYSNRYIFPEETQAKLKTIAKLIADDPKPCRTQEDMQAATRWHTEHFDDTKMKF